MIKNKSAVSLKKKKCKINQQHVYNNNLYYYNI